MLAKQTKREFLDKLHRGFVMTCIGVTGLGLVMIGFNVFAMIQGAKAKEKIMLAELDQQNEQDEFPSKRLQGTGFYS